ncbi:MAG: hypothetical protein H6907_12955 [Hyphomicrobiales bacterium]|nr:hypothetical protein [Hyphomicrobiales bacterium]
MTAFGRDPGRVVIGAAVGYGYADLKPFVLSLADTGYDGHVCLLVSRAETDTDSIAALQALGVDVESFETWRFMPMCVHLARYIKYFEYLDGHSFERVMLSDTRDVVFQKDPFDIGLPGDLHYFAEDRGVRIGNCRDNSNWVRSALGQAALDAIAAKAISCSGITLGNRRGIMRYLITMLQLAGQADAGSLRIDGIDQGLHNVLVHGGMVDGALLVENARHVNTMGHLPGEAIRVSDRAIAENADGTVSAVLHQYDYDPHQAIHDAVRRRYG